MPRISGRSGRMLLRADPVQAEGPQRAAVLGLGADARLDLGDRHACGGRPSGHLVRDVGAPLGLLVGPPDARPG